MPPSWDKSPLRKLTQPKGGTKLPRTCLVGVGSDLGGDDSAGLWVARALLQDERAARAEHLLIVEGGLAPENHTGQLRAFHPDLVLLVDAAHLDQPPGTIEWIPLDAIDGMSASSHSLPLSMLAHYLTLELGCDVAILGIQPAQNELDSALSAHVQAAVEDVVGGVREMFLPTFIVG